MKNLTNTLFFLISATVSLTADPVAAASPDAITGTYASIDGRNSKMIVRKKANQYQIALYGGALRSDGMSTGGDCEAHMVGEKIEDLIKAKLVPFNGETMSIDADDLATLNQNVLLSMQPRKIVVKGDFSYCGLRVDLSGTYRKK